MRVFLFFLVLVAISGCGLSTEQKFEKIKYIQEVVLSSDENINLTKEDYEFLRSVDLVFDPELHPYDLIKEKNNLYVKFVASFLDPQEKIEVKNKIISFFKVDRQFSFPIEKEIYGKKYLNVRFSIDGQSPFDIQTRLLIYQEYADIIGSNFDLSDVDFLKNELCFAADKELLAYASALIDISIDKFDPGKIRCIDGGDKAGNNMVVFKGSTEGMKRDSEVISKLGVCPMSLRRISGRNYGDAVSSRISSWQYNIQQIDADSIKSLDDAKNKIKGTFANIPKLNPVPGSMNSLFDKYNKWPSGGDCSI